MKLRSDFFFKNESAKNIDIKLADPLQPLSSKLPILEELPHISSISEALRQIIEQKQTKMITVLEFQRKFFIILETSEPIILNMKILRSTIQNRFREIGTCKMSVTNGFCSFCNYLFLNF